MYRFRPLTAWTVLAGLALAPLAAIASQSPPACPSEPTRVTRSVGGVNDYFGSAPGIADLCRMSRPDGPGDFYYGAWRSDWPGAGQAYPAILAVVAGGMGTRASFVTRSYPGMQWADTFINEGPDTVVVDGVSHATFKLAHERQGIEGNTYHSVITSWHDTDTGIVLKTVERQISGQSYGPSTTWQAVRVERLR